MRLFDSIQAKLLSLVLMLALIGATNGVLGLVGMKHGVEGLDTVYQDRVVPLRDLKQIADAYAVDIVDTNHKVRNGNMSLDAGIRSVERAKKLIHEKWRGYLATRLVDREKQLVAELEPLMRRGDLASDRLVALFRAEDMEGIAHFSVQELYPSIDPISEGFGKLIEVQLDVARAEYDAAQEEYGLMRLVVVILMLAGAFGGLGIAWFTIQRFVVGPMASAGEAISAMARGDLTQPVPESGNNEIGAMLRHLDAMQVSLRVMIGAIHGNVCTLNESSRDMVAAATVSARVSQEQSEAASGMAAGVEELSVSIDQVEENAREANIISNNSGERLNSSASAMHAAASGIQGIAHAVTQAAGTIRELEGLSTRISNIVGVIKEIADQTNLLALNAAIEAARAGEQGRGFAVVADEVRKLAERTAHSTNEISGMIQAIQQGSQRAVLEMESGVESVNKGVALAETAGTSVSVIQEASGQIHRSVEDISLSIREQAVAARDIALRVEQIAQSAETNSATASQTAGAAGRLGDLAGELQEAVSRFRL